MSKNINATIKEKIEIDDVEYIKRLIAKGQADQLFTKANFEYAAQKGAANVLKAMLHPDLDETVKINAMFLAAQAHQVETVKVLEKAGVSLGYALGSLTDHELDRPFIDTILNPKTGGLGYEPSDEDLHFYQLAGKSNVLAALQDRAKQQQALYKEALVNFLGNATATEGMDEQKAMLRASADGTAADIDRHVAGGEQAENAFWLKNLDVAVWHGNDSTAQALIKHGAEVKPEYLNIARRYCNEQTIEAVRTAQEQQIEQQAPTLTTEPTKGSTQAKKQTLKISL